MSEYLFPNRLTRRDFLRWTGAAGVAAGLTAGDAPAANAKNPVTIGSGKFHYTLDESWGTLPKGMTFGYGCGMVADSQDRVYVLSRSINPCVAVFDKDGKLLETWSKQFAANIGYESPNQVVVTAYGLSYSKEGDGEYLYWTENSDGPKAGPKIGARVYKTDLKGKVLYTIGNVANESPISQKFDFANPTGTAVSPNGDIYVVDGFGSMQLHRFDKNFKPLKTIGGLGKEHGQFNSPHGVWVNTLRKEPEVYVADRGNNRIEVFSPELDYKRTLRDFRLPSSFSQHGGLLYVPELSRRVAVVDAEDDVVARLGSTAYFKLIEIEQHPDRFGAPQAVTLTSNGDLYVIEWINFGRARKFKHTPV